MWPVSYANDLPGGLFVSYIYHEDPFNKPRQCGNRWALLSKPGHTSQAMASQQSNARQSALGNEINSSRAARLAGRVAAVC